MTPRRWLAVGAAGAVLLAVLAVLGVVRRDDPPAGSTGAVASVDPACEPTTPEELEVEVLRTLPHDPRAYTQGLLVLDGRLFESTGRTGESTVREVDPDTGEVIRQVPLAPDEFGEGLTVTDDGRLVQLTWVSGVAYEWDPDTLERLGEFDYSGEGWGLTTLEDGTLAMTDGSDELTVRDPDDFEELDRRVVQRVGGDADRLNELEWDGAALWANRFQTDELLRIDPECAVVTGVADLSALREAATLVAEEQGTRISVTNGIAHLPGTDRYLVTGKWWPTMYEVRIS
jgi:glutaminyl-peptide cyclotransferase